MPSLVRKLLICAAADGLLLHPVGTRDRESSLSIPYGPQPRIRPIKAAERSDDDDEGDVVEAHGIVGLLSLASSSYLISITRREQVAQIHGKPIFEIKDVALIPLTSQSEAASAITIARKHIAGGGRRVAGEETDDSDVGDDSDTASLPDADHTPPPEPESPQKSAAGKSTSIVKNIVQDRGRYGRFADRWFSRGGGWTLEGRKRQGMKSEEALAMEQSAKDVDNALEVDQAPAPTSGTVEEKGGPAQAPEEKLAKPEDEDSKEKKPSQQKAAEALTPRIVRAARLYYSSSGFFFSYDHDLSRSVLSDGSTATSLPLWKRHDPQFFWNHHLISPFINAGQDAFILPLLQGFIGQRKFSITRTQEGEQDAIAEDSPTAPVAVDAPSEHSEPSKQEALLLTLISRRSVDRAGLRYLRRGIDDRGHVANNVETEQLLSHESWDPSEKGYSLTQIRGSIPVFFSQTPYSFKPLPTLFGSDHTNQAAFKLHFENMAKRYGGVHAACLIDKHGNEVKVGEEYEKNVKTLNDGGGVSGKPIAFEWFDFHKACGGMKFENVSILLDTLKDSLTTFGWSIHQNGKASKQQSGILRTNCMDCLDRTNVVQSAVGGWALQEQLADLGLSIDLKSDPKTQWFNTLWADNGDYISKQYAGTSALKGDFTRTRKRNWTGMLSDFSLTLNRYYNNIFGDYFLQTCIDFYLGNSNISVFDDFEANMMSKDYALDMQRIRQDAIDLCIKIVLEDPDEEPVAGWTLSCPHQANSVRQLPFEECILLLTHSAIYFCRFDWDNDKVGSFERIDLLDISELWRGAYITSTLASPHMDENKNVGFALRYNTSGKAIVRTNTRSLQNEKAADDENAVKNEVEKQAEPDKQEQRLLAFKALPPKSSASKKEGKETASMAEIEVVKHICEEIHRLMKDVALKDRGFDHLQLDKVPEIQEKPVVSVADAKKNTGYLESIGYSLKKMVWS